MKCKKLLFIILIQQKCSFLQLILQRPECHYLHIWHASGNQWGNRKMFYYPLCCLSHSPINWQLINTLNIKVSHSKNVYTACCCQHQYFLVCGCIHSQLLNCFRLPQLLKVLFKHSLCPVVIVRMYVKMSASIHIIILYYIMEVHFHKNRLTINQPNNIFMAPWQCC